MTSRKRPLRHYLRSLYSWHRWLGVLSALFVLLLASTGFVLNRGESWQLAERAAPRWLQAQYGIVAPLPERALERNGHWFTVHEGWLYYDATRITPARMLSGVLHAGDTYLVATDRGLATLSGEQHAFAAPGQLIEMLPDERAADRVASSQPRWQAPPREIAEALQADAMGRALNWERVLLDLHSGRLLGRYGTLLMDVAAVLFVVLALTGLTLWLRYHWRQRRRRRRFPLSRE